MADKLASFGGSWTFLIIFASILFIWIGLNSFLLLKKPFAPYPFILLNLISICLAAIQAAVIMVSQNRQGDYIKAYLDHLINWEFTEINLD